MRGGRRRSARHDGASASIPRRRRSTALVLSALLVTAGVSACDSSASPGPGGSPSASQAPATRPPGESPEDYAAAIAALTNDARETEGLPPLDDSACAREQALARATELVGADELTHAPLGPVQDACGGALVAGENLSRSAVDPERVVEAWMGSPGHRANIVDPEYAGLGVACVPVDVDGAQQLLCSQVFLGWNPERALS